MKINCRLHVKICANRSFYVTTIKLVSDIGIPSIRRLHAICVNFSIQNCSSTHNFHAFVLLLFLMMIPFIRAKMQIFYQIIPNNIVPGVVLFPHLLRLYGITHHMRCMHTVSATRIVHFIWFLWTLFFPAHTKYIYIIILSIYYYWIWFIGAVQSGQLLIGHAESFTHFLDIVCMKRVFLSYGEERVWEKCERRVWVTPHGHTLHHRKRMKILWSDQHHRTYAGDMNYKRKNQRNMR